MKFAFLQRCHLIIVLTAIASSALAHPGHDHPFTPPGHPMHWFIEPQHIIGWFGAAAVSFTFCKAWQQWRKSRQSDAQPSKAPRR